MAFVTRRRRCGQMLAAGREKAEVYSLEYIEDFFLDESDVDGRESFAAIERLMSDNLLRLMACAFQIRHAACWIVLSR